MIAETIWQAKEARARAWRDRLAGRITTEQMYAVLRDLRARFGHALYER